MSTLHCNTVETSSGGAVTLTKQSAAKAWTNLNMSTGTYRDSFNIASATDNGTGDFTNNYTSAMANANYNHEYTQFENGRTGGYLLSNYGTYVTASLLRGRARESGGALNDSDYVGLTVHGDLA
jgi:hypothetical protein